MLTRGAVQTLLTIPAPLLLAYDIATKLGVLKQVS